MAGLGNGQQDGTGGMKGGMMAGKTGLGGNGDGPFQGGPFPRTGVGGGEFHFGAESSEAGTKAADRQLKPTAMNMQDSSLVNIQFATPEVNREAAGGASGVLRTTKASGGSASGSAVLPKHKAAVSQYFTRTQQ